MLQKDPSPLTGILEQARQRLALYKFVKACLPDGCMWLTPRNGRIFIEASIPPSLRSIFQVPDGE